MDDEDLEEGEILDDRILPQITELKKRKHKVLPKRYTLHENNAGHKKCKKSVRPKSKKLVSDRGSSKVSASRHKSLHACSRHDIWNSYITKPHKKSTSPKPPRVLPKSIFGIKSNKSTNNMPVAAANVNYSLKTPNFSVINPFSNANGDSFDINSSFEDLLDYYKKIQSELKHIEWENYPTPNKRRCRKRPKISHVGEKSSISFENKRCIKPLPVKPKSVDIQDFKIQIEANGSVANSELHPSSIPVESTTPSDDEDEAALRQIALASCLNSSNNIHKRNSNEKTNATEPSFDVKNSDNYDVVDMDLDENQSDVVIEVNNVPTTAVDYSNLFVIDTTPSLPFIQDKNEILSEINNEVNSNDDFEETMLRAQLILSMNQKQKNLSVNKIDKPQINVNLAKNNQQVLLPPVEVRNDKNKSFPLVKMVAKKNYGDTYAKEIRESSKRIVIELNETSSDESCEEEEDKKANLAGLEALISNARQRSGNALKNSDSAPEIVSCLSKSQQLEYSKLKKIIADKESSQIQQKVVTSSMNDLELLEKKLTLAVSTMQKEKQLLNVLKAQVVKKRSDFIASQSAIQRLKDQLIVAERIKKNRMQVLGKGIVHQQTFQRYISKRQTLIDDLLKECNKLGSSIHGSNYAPPYVTANLLRTSKVFKKAIFSAANS